MNTDTKCHITAQFVLGMPRHSKDTPHLINKKENNQSASYQAQFLTDNTKNKVVRGKRQIILHGSSSQTSAKNTSKTNGIHGISGLHGSLRIIIRVKPCQNTVISERLAGRLCHCVGQCHRMVRHNDKMIIAKPTNHDHHAYYCNQPPYLLRRISNKKHECNDTQNNQSRTQIPGHNQNHHYRNHAWDQQHNIRFQCRQFSSHTCQQIGHKDHHCRLHKL